MALNSALPRRYAWALALTAVCAMVASLAAAATSPPPTAPAVSKTTAAPGAKPAVTKGGKAAAPSTKTPATAPKSKPAVNGTKPVAPKAKPKQKPGEVMELNWRDLLPENERSRYSDSAPPPQHGPLGEGGPPAVQKATTTFNEELGDLVVRLPGFVVPIGTSRDGLITEFFLVPYIGACIHVPPPPSNQMVYVTSASGIAADAIHEAYWVMGKMRIESHTTSLGTAAYAVTATKVDLYEY